MPAGPACSGTRTRARQNPETRPIIRAYAVVFTTASLPCSCGCDLRPSIARTTPFDRTGLRVCAWPRQLLLRRIPARSPRETTLIATLRDASSIISSPNITAPLRSPSVVAFS